MVLLLVYKVAVRLPSCAHACYQPTPPGSYNGFQSPFVSTETWTPSGAYTHSRVQCKCIIYLTEIYNRFPRFAVYDLEQGMNSQYWLSISYSSINKRSKSSYSPNLKTKNDAIITILYETSQDTLKIT
ncbi:uncharacterized protein LOC117215807 [Bombus bifarius]|uniref:Uncharacterized protein LOC117215807 n=1 Tax=Bombus bifarius TaxID=103933 RepID=A0A6P8NAN9_9HYME|nr:uncharacterized protein LOC117161870 [Bombus vancouverensis nearcticus]XP_033318173.1 uncharacterized protein LOC117215807 [Bombus bifarius]